MSDTPGWASPGSPAPQDHGSGQDDRPPADPAPQQPPAGHPAQPQGWTTAPPPQGPPGWGTTPPGGPQQTWGAPQPGWGQGQAGWGQGQNGGWGGWRGWHPHLFVAKPGVIPLRPLGVGEILDGAVTTARTHWRTVLTVALGIAVITQLISTLAMHYWLGDSDGLAALEDNPNPTDAEIRDALADLFAFTSITGLITLLGTVLATAMLTMVVGRAVLGRSVTIGEAWQDSRSRLPRLLGLVLLVPLAAGLAVGIPVLLAALTGSPGLTAAVAIAGIVFAIWLWISSSLAAPALILERQGVVASLRRSFKLVRGSWWRVFGITLLSVLLITVVGGIMEIPTSLIAGWVSGDGGGNPFEASSTDLSSWAYLVVSGIGAVISSTLTLPISAGVTALLYIDQRIRREALDIELARSAGVSPSGTPES
ncbi:DUF7544 domain-containing protein [Streptomyces hoynatensis]|uniref:Glycerophosphoryl diester phosphodiesterase membrane domain-containing protein n=1 Tax=Streptomyces hoynatensis TaxID=1141874 RepID=A0A3A9YV07_9ACTN|nr:hypothetical protein [Streptomyces hoynatensis]RKN39868.1 hypothetical protein D7294_20720 [Streptomyces hoynatensis]